MKYLLYINLWGTTAKLSEGADLLGDVCECRERLAAALTESETQVLFAGDDTYVLHSDLATLVRIAARVFSDLSHKDKQFKFYPLRASIGRLSVDVLPMATGFRFAANDGVEILRLEKSAQKGARLFAEASLSDELILAFGPRWVAERATRGLPHVEINWYAIADRDLDREFAAEAARLMEVGSNYSQQLAASLYELLKWTGPSARPSEPISELTT